MVSDTQAPNGPDPTATSVGMDASSTKSLAEYMEIMQSRLDDLTKKYDELAAKQKNDKTDTEPKKEPTKDDEKEKEKDKEKDKDKKKEESTSDDVDENIKLTPELNRLTWVEWRKLKTWEENWDTKTTAQKKKEIEKRRVKLKKYVVDVVSDQGDLGLHASADTDETWTPGRIRINSEHVMDALNEITSITASTPCQILHPFKMIVDFVEPIREHIKILEANLDKAKTALNTAKTNGATENKAETSSSAPQEDESADSAKAKDSKESEKQNPKKTLEEEEVELAEEKCSHYRCLLNLIDTNLGAEIKVAASIRSGTAKKIMFSHLWHLFVPGENVLFEDPNRIQPRQISQILKVSGGRARLQHPSALQYFFMSDRQFRSKYSPFTIDSFHLDFDGNARKFRLVQNKYEIPRFTGECPIIALKIFPLRFLPEPSLSETLEMLLKRGENFQSLASVETAHREYHGMSLDKEREEINGRIIIDFKLGASSPGLDRTGSDQSNQSNTEEDHRIFGLRLLTQTDENEITETTTKNEYDSTLYNDHTYDVDRSDKLFLQNRVLLAPSQELDSAELTENELRLLPGTAIAYVLRSRKYCKCDISLIEIIKLNETAFMELVLPKGYHNLIRSLVDKHSYGRSPVEKKIDLVPQSPLHRSQPEELEASQTHQDTLSIVKGKGLGLIILLHGVPGVGKTSTAETIADATNRPLLSVTCGDIGESASEVERNLELIFTNSHRWGCVLLLDEAEVFLAKRNHEDLKRNAMVSVFLRMLEYYSGILFLTTNRVGTIDEAFKSRIHVSLYYPPLDWRASKAIWQVNLDRSKDRISANDAAIVRFAKKHYHNSDENTRWNGRQIYNAFKTAIALAQIEEKDGKGKSGKQSDAPASRPKLQPDHFRQIAHASRQFDKYLLETQGESVAAVNKQNRVRDDSFGVRDRVPTLKRRTTRTKLVDLSDLPDTSEESTEVSEGLSDESTEESSEEEQQRKSSSKKKSSKKAKASSSSKKGEDKKASAKKKKSKQASSGSEDESS